jgi:voltage-gated potassium channel
VSTLLRIEWMLTILFTIEYLARLACARYPLRYAISFWGVIDLLSVLPTYAAFFVAEGQAGSFVILRSIRLLRAFRVLKLWRMMDDAEELSQAVWKARHKIIVFLIVVLVAVTISGTLMYFVENVVPRMLAGQDLPEERVRLIETQFDSIPQAMYWAIVTMTTVGYGDIVPKTTAGKFISATLILLGYSLIIVPSGFVTAELSGRERRRRQAESLQAAKPGGRRCPRCDASGHRDDAGYCYRCGERLTAKA